MNKKTKFVTFVILIILLVNGVSCSKQNKSDEVSMQYYTMDDFNTIIVGKSTYRDVYEVAKPELVQATSYGCYCLFDTNDNNKICIKFYGSDLIVGHIELLSADDY